jgi:hypothetical protein
MHSNRAVEPPDRGAPGSSGAVAGRAQAAARKRAVAATIAERSARRAAGAGLAVLPPPAPESPREGVSESTPLFARHTRGTIEAERDRRLQRRARAATAYRAAARERDAGLPHPRLAAAVAADARAVRQARRDIDRWVDEGGLVSFEADALTRRTMSRR